MNLIMLLFVFVLGLFIGSFLNVCICRLPKEESIVFPPSHCPKCKKRLGIPDLMPVFSYLILRGRCRYCGDSISFRYPLVEILTGILFVAVFFKFGAVPDIFFHFIFISILVGVTFTDIETQTIHDYFPFTGIAAGILYGLYSGSLTGSLVATAAGAGVFIIIRSLGKFLYKREAMGEGDVLLAAMIGAFLGPATLIVSIALSFLMGAVFSIILLASGAKKRGEEIPFGPYLAASAVIALFWGDAIWRWYLGH